MIDVFKLSHLNFSSCLCFPWPNKTYFGQSFIIFFLSLQLVCQCFLSVYLPVCLSVYLAIWSIWSICQTFNCLFSFFFLPIHVSLQVSSVTWNGMAAQYTHPYPTQLKSSYITSSFDEFLTNWQTLAHIIILLQPLWQQIIIETHYCIIKYIITNYLKLNKYNLMTLF